MAPFSITVALGCSQRRAASMLPASEHCCCCRQTAAAEAPRAAAVPQQQAPLVVVRAVATGAHALRLALNRRCACGEGMTAWRQVLRSHHAIGDTPQPQPQCSQGLTGPCQLPSPIPTPKLFEVRQYELAKCVVATAQRFLPLAVLCLQRRPSL